MAAGFPPADFLPPGAPWASRAGKLPWGVDACPRPKGFVRRPDPRSGPRKTSRPAMATRRRRWRGPGQREPEPGDAAAT